MILTIADNLTDLINSATLSQEIVAQRSVMPKFSLEDLSGVKIAVVPASMEQELANRSEVETSYSIEVGIQKKVSSAVDSEVEPLIQLVTEISDLIRSNRVLGSAIWVKTERNPVYDRDHLASQLVFTSLLTVTYTAIE